MDLSAPVLSCGTQYQWTNQSSDSEFYSLSSPETVSPAHSMDFSWSPSFQPWIHCMGAQVTPSSGTQASISPSSGEEGVPRGGRARGRRSRNPSKQRQSASEKEKLRMRDLTKALHHLRTYLPPSVAPAGQTLTKIETLRLAIRYIGHLSAQLGLSEELLSQRKELNSCFDQTRGPAGCCGCSSAPEFWGHGQMQRQPAGGQQNTLTSVPPMQNARGDHSHHSHVLGVTVQEHLLKHSLDSLLQSPQRMETTQSPQMNSKNFLFQVAQEFRI